MDQQNYDQQQIQNPGQQPQQIQYQVQQQQQIHNPNQSFLQQQSQQIQNYGQRNISSDNLLPVITNSPFQNMSNNNNVSNVMTTQSLSQPSQQQQPINNDSNRYDLSSVSNFNNNRDSNLNIPPLNSLNCGNIHHNRNKNGNDPLVTVSRHMLIIKDYMVKIEQHYFEMEQILNGLRRHSDTNN